MSVVRSRRVERVLAAFAGAGSALTLAGWIGGIPVLTDWGGTGISQMPNNAIAIVTAAVGVLCASFAKRRAAVVLASFAALVAGATLFEHATSIDLGLDTLLFHPAWGQRGAVAPGRMGLPSSVCLVVIGVSIILGAFERTRRASTAGGLFVMAVSLLSLIGYTFGADPLFAIPRITTIALQTSTMLFALGGALLAAVPERAPTRLLLGDSSAALLVRRTLPAVVVLPFVFGWLGVRGEEAGLYDTAFGTGLLVLTLIALLVALLWWCAEAIFVHERATRESRDRLATILGSITDAFIAVDPDWRVVFMNDEAEALLGSRASAEGQSVWRAAGGLDASIHEPLRRAMAERAPVDCEAFLPASKRWFSTRAYPMPDGGLAMYWHDITDRKLAEESLRKSAEALVAADRMKDEFLATLSHELRTPLTSIVGWSQLLLTAELDKREQRSALEAIRSSAKAQAQLVEDVLDVSRVITGKLRLEREETDLVSVVEAAIATVRPAAEAKRIALHVDLDRTLPRVVVDPERVQQIVWNLLSNSIKFSASGTRVSIVLTVDGAHVVIDVTDEGRGIPRDFLPHVFERFRQADSSASRSHTGLGIGLALTKDLVELHGGTIAAESEEGRGSRFTVHLPLVTATQPARDAATSRESASSLSGVRVLYVDDREDARLLIGTMLRRHGAEVVQAASVDEALDALSGELPHVVLTDLAMPGRDGFDLLTSMRESERLVRLPVVALTAQGRIDDEARAATAGFRAFLRKPIDPEHLAAAVARVVNPT